MLTIEDRRVLINAAGFLKSVTPHLAKYKVSAVGMTSGKTDEGSNGGVWALAIASALLDIAEKEME